MNILYHMFALATGLAIGFMAGFLLFGNIEYYAITGVLLLIMIALHIIMITNETKSKRKL